MAQGHVTSSRRLYLDKNGKAVDENDPAAVELFASAGSPIPFARAQEVGLIDDTGNLRPDLFGMSYLPAPAKTVADEENDFGKVSASKSASPAKTQSKEQ